MKKLFILLFFTGIVFSGFSQNNLKPIMGNWTYSVDTGDMILTGTLHFFEKESGLSGEILSDDGYTIPLTTVEQKEDNIYYLEAKTDYDLYKITLNFEGDKFSGNASSYQGEAPITGQRKE